MKKLDAWVDFLKDYEKSGSDLCITSKACASLRRYLIELKKLREEKHKDVAK